MIATGCPGIPAEPEVRPAELGWATGIVTHPETFSALMDETSREGWIAVHAHDLDSAKSAFAENSPASAWASFARGQERLDLQRLTSEAALRLVRTWEERGSLPEGPGPVFFAAYAATCGHRPADAWVARLPVAERAWFEGTAPWPWKSEAADVAQEGARIRYATPPGEAWKRPPFTDRVVETDGAGQTVRTWQDPCLPSRLAPADTGVAHRVLNTYEDGLELHLNPDHQPDLSKLVHTLFSARGVSTDALGLPDDVPASDDPEAAREEVRALDAVLDATRAHLEQSASPDGLALLQQIQPLSRLRQEVLVDRARRDLRAGHVQRAYATLLLARDVTERGIGPANGPALYVLLAEANLRAGRTREALDALQPVVDVIPESTATREILSDLVVLEGMDRTGDSKEH